MLSKKFYDWLTLIAFVLVALFIILSITSFSSSGFSAIGNYWTLMWIILTVYWIFALVLAIQLATRKLTKIVDVVVIALIPPLAIIFYLTNLRSSLKKAEKTEANSF